MSYIDKEKFLSNVQPWLDGTTLVVSLNEIKNAPTEEVEPIKHGKWIEEYVPDPDPWNRNRFRCSICNRIEDKKEPYCNCGAKMETIL